MAHAVKQDEASRAFTLGDLGDVPYELERPLSFELAFGQSGYTLTEPNTGVFAYDRDLTAALVKLQRALVDEIEFLSSQQQLSARLQQNLEFLRSVIRRK